MDWQQCYQAPDDSHWQGRSGLSEGSAYFQIVTPYHLTKNAPAHSEKAIALLGFCSDEGVARNQGRVGAADGPNAIRKQFAKLSPRNEAKVFDAGNIICQDGRLEEAQFALAEVVCHLLEANMVPILLGGGHEIAWGHYLGLEKFLKKGSLGIVNFDAHFDMRPMVDEKPTSGTPFLQIAVHQLKMQKSFSYLCLGIQESGNSRALFETAKKYQVEHVTAGEIWIGDQLRLTQRLDHHIQKNDYLYTSICLDVFAFPFAPGVSAPQPLGLLPWQVVPLIRKLAHSKKVISYDVAELCPKHDSFDRTAKLAATLVAEIIQYHK